MPISWYGKNLGVWGILDHQQDGTSTHSMEKKFPGPFKKLDTEPVWIQFHHLPIEFWEIEMLENIAQHFDWIIINDDHTLNYS